MNNQPTIQRLKKVPLSILMEAFPQNYMMMRDSGLWIIYDGDTDEATDVATQGANQSYEDFMYEFFADELLRCDDPEMIELDVACIEAEYHSQQRVHISELMQVLTAIRKETTPIEGHDDPGAIQDCWSTAFDYLRENGAFDDQCEKCILDEECLPF